MSLVSLREEINELDSKIIKLIAERQKLAPKIAKIKIHQGIPIHDEKRTAEVLAQVFERAVEYKIDPVAIQQIFEILIAMNEDRQHACSGEGNLP
jgi:chorismate mutase